MRVVFKSKFRYYFCCIKYQTSVCLPLFFGFNESFLLGDSNALLNLHAWTYLASRSRSKGQFHDTMNDTFSFFWQKYTLFAL